MGPDYGKSLHENHSHGKTRLPDYHDSAANVTNSAFYSNRVTASGPIATSKQKHSKFALRIKKYSLAITFLICVV